MKTNWCFSSISNAFRCAARTRSRKSGRSSQRGSAPLGHKVKAIVNYDNFVILPELLDPYSDMVRGLMADYYSHVTRYTTSGFLRMKLGKALQKRGVAPHIYELAAEAAEAEAVEHAAKHPEGV